MAPAHSGSTSPPPRSRPSGESRTRTCEAGVSAGRAARGLGNALSAEHAREEVGERVHVFFVAQAGQARAHLRDRRLDELQERRVLFYAVDEDEAPRVLELALHGHAIEVATELAARRHVE